MSLKACAIETCFRTLERAEQVKLMAIIGYITLGVTNQTYSGFALTGISIDVDDLDLLFRNFRSDVVSYDVFNAAVQQWIKLRPKITGASYNERMLSIYTTKQGWYVDGTALTSFEAMRVWWIVHGCSAVTVDDKDIADM
jgi:hypothetical protein